MENIENLEAWIAKETAAEQTGLSIRQLDRKIAAGELRREYRTIPGRKPLPVIHPDDVAKLNAVTLKPVPGPKRHEPDMSLSVPITQKLYLTLPEAAAYSGLPKSYLLKCVQMGKLQGVKLGSWKIRRSDLFRHVATPVLIPKQDTKLLTSE